MITRRAILKGGSLAVASAAAGLCMPNIVRASDKRVVTPSFGGSYEAMLKEAIMDPFTKETGVEVVFSGSPDFARLKAQVQSGNVEWDLFDCTAGWGPTGSVEGLFEPLDPAIVPPHTLKGDKKDHASFYRSAGVIGWNEAHVEEARRPAGFADFWNVEKFPGRRSLRNRVDFVLDIALVADGVDPANLYPLDIDRGFAAIERIKPHITKWAESSSQATQLITSNEVDFTFTFNNRIRGAVQEGHKLGMALSQAVYSNEYLAVIKGSPNKDNAMQLLGFALRPEVQANLSAITGFVPGNTEANSLLSPEVFRWIPDPSGPHIVQDDAWWVENLEALQTRFVEMMLQ